MQVHLHHAQLIQVFTHHLQCLASLALSFYHIDDVLSVLKKGMHKRKVENFKPLLPNLLGCQRSVAGTIGQLDFPRSMLDSRVTKTGRYESFQD